jgi:HlyD family secretion protein
MKRLPFKTRTLALIAVIVPLLALFLYVALRSGPLAPVSVTAETVETRSISPAIFGIGTIEARYAYRIGPTFAGRLLELDVHVGDRVQAGQVLGGMDPVDLDDRIRSQEAAFKRAEAMLRETEARQVYAQTQAQRYEQLFQARSVSEELLSTRRQELQIADAALSGAREDLVRARSDREGLIAQRRNLLLIAPVDGVVAARNADPGTTVVAGEAVVDLIDTESLWINARFDQISASGLAAGLPARIVLRSRAGRPVSGRILRVEPVADAVTEETLAKVVFDTLPESLPPLGELAEITVDLPALPPAPVIYNAAIVREGGRIGVWQLVDGDARFTPIRIGATDLEGNVQVVEGVRDGDRVVVFREKALTERSRIRLVESVPEVLR